MLLVPKNATELTATAVMHKSASLVTFSFFQGEKQINI
jgi:hypothetical protein